MLDNTIQKHNIKNQKLPAVIKVKVAIKRVLGKRWQSARAKSNSPTHFLNVVSEILTNPQDEIFKDFLMHF